MLRGKLMIKESYLILVIIMGIVMMCLYSTFALFSLEKTTSKDIISLNTSNVDVSLSISEYEQLALAAGEIKTVYLNVTNDNANTIYYGVWYQMVSPSTITTDITIAKIPWSANPTSGTISASANLPVELVIRNESTSSITVNIGVAGSDTNELGLTGGKTLITDTFYFFRADQISDFVTNYSYTGDVYGSILERGTYKLEAWGAEGGPGYTYSTGGGKGGYSYGILDLNIPMENILRIYVYVGGQGSVSAGSSTTRSGAGFNANSSSVTNSAAAANYAGGGGGASDIRIGQDSLYARVIVAGGGGGKCGYASQSYCAGGVGGGTSGVSGVYQTSTTTNTTYAGQGGTQTAGGATGTYSSYQGSAGGFGYGGYGGVRSTSKSYRGAGAGGGGWYGGGGGTYRYAGGGGGSGYVYTSSTASNYPSGCLLDSSYYLTDAATIAGDQSFNDPDGNTETGHSGNGYVRITRLVPSIDTSSVSIALGTDTNLKDIVTCEDGGNGCKILFVSPNNTKQLTAGSHNAFYVLEDNSGTRYEYTKVINIS